MVLLTDDGQITGRITSGVRAFAYHYRPDLFVSKIETCKIHLEPGRDAYFPVTEGLLKYVRCTPNPARLQLVHYFPKKSDDPMIPLAYSHRPDDIERPGADLCFGKDTYFDSMRIHMFVKITACNEGGTYQLRIESLDMPDADDVFTGLNGHDPMLILSSKLNIHPPMRSRTWFYMVDQFWKAACPSLWAS